MVGLHVLAAWATVAIALVTLAVAIGLAAGRWASRQTVDRAILALVAATALAAWIGVALPLIGPAPSDPLHILYGIVGLVAVPLARYIGRGDDRRVGRFVAVGVVVTLGALLRLFMTGS